MSQSPRQPSPDSAADHCPDCDASSPIARSLASLSRRHVMRTAAVVGAGMMLPPMIRVTPRAAAAEPAAAGAAGETLVAQLYRSLNDAQRKAICFGFDHPLRSEVNNNWQIVEQRVGRFFTADQQDLIRQIFNSLHSERYAESVMKQVEHDNGKAGFGACSVAIFGEPGTGKFEFVLTGRHVTRRCDGDSVAGAAFGGPIFYGHAAKGFHEGPHHEGNAYWYQALAANKLYAALDGKQRKLALRTDAREEDATNTVRLVGKNGPLAGIPATELTADQKALLRTTLADVLAPFRKTDVDEAMKLIDAAGGIDSLAMAYYSNMDIGNDGVWDVWQIEGPNMVWFFRGKPHVHTWVNIAAPA